MPFQQLSFNHIYNRCPMSQVTENPKSSAMHLACSWLTQSRERWLNQREQLKVIGKYYQAFWSLTRSDWFISSSTTKERLIVNPEWTEWKQTHTNTHNCKSGLQRMCWFTWGTHCCRVRVHMTGIFSPAATSIVSSLRNGKQKRHLRWKGLLLLPWNKQNNFLKSNFGYWLVIADLFIFAHL